SHFIGSFVGLVLLIAARGLWRRQRGAWWLALSLTLLSIPLAPLKGLGFFPPSVALFLLARLCLRHRGLGSPTQPLPRRRRRHASIMAGGCVVLASFAIFFIASHETACAHSLWWQFALNGGTPWGVRLALMLSALVLAIGVWQLMRPQAI